MNIASSLDSTTVCYATFYGCCFLAYKLCEKYKRKRILSLGDHLMHLPRDIIAEILSYLSVEDFINYTSVWKPWKAVAEDHKFTEKFMMGKPKKYLFTQFLTKYDNREVQKYSRPLALCDGLILKMKYTWGISEHFWMNWNYEWRTSLYVRNPATHQTLHLPEPHAERLGIGYSFAFIPSTAMYKIVSVYSEGNMEKLAVLTLRSDEHEWRYLDIPNPRNIISAKTATGVIHSDGAVHCIRDVKVESRLAYEIRTFDLKSECFTVTYVYKDLIAKQEKLWPPNWKETLPLWPMNWNEKLSFVYLDGTELNVLTLEDYKSKTWSRKFVIYLSFMETEMGLQNLVPLIVQDGLLWCVSDDYTKVYHYNLEVLKITEAFVCERGCKYGSGPFCYVPSVLSLKGMQTKQKGFVNVVLLACGLNYLGLIWRQITIS